MDGGVERYKQNHSTLIITGSVSLSNAVLSLPTP